MELLDKLTPEGKKFFEELEELERLALKVGYQAGEKEYPDGADMVDIAYYNEVGTDTIPSRPFLRQTFDEHQSELEAFANACVDRLVNGGSADAVYKRLGTYVKGLVQTQITDGDFAENAASTIAAKGSSHPLIDTGLMRASVNFVIEEGDD